MELVDVQEVEHSVEGVAPVCIHTVSFLNFVKVDDGIGSFSEGENFVVELLVGRVSVVLKEGTFATQEVTCAQYIYLSIEDLPHVKIY